MMNYRIEKKNTFDVVVKKKYFSTDMELSKQQIPEFWNSCRENGTISELCKYIAKDNMFGNAVVGMCFENVAKDNQFPYAIGVAYEGGNISEGLSVEKIDAHTWAIFECTGAMPTAVQELLHKIYSEFFPTSEYQSCGGLYFEVYPDGDVQSPEYKCEIWISVEKKS